jgi:hypothetical protein
LFLLPIGVLILLAALWGGLLRLGWPLPSIPPVLPAIHGALMIAFLGALISLERAIALGRRWAYGAPLLSCAGALLLLTGWSYGAGALLLTLGSLGLAASSALAIRRQPAPFTIVMALGALAWLVGNSLWLAGRPIFSIVLWWAGFLVLTIAGERLELGRLLSLPRPVHRAFELIVALLLIGLAVSTLALDMGVRLASASLILLALWLLRYDIARRTIRKRGLTRFIAVCMLSGYMWLGVSGAIGLLYGGVPAGPRYDAFLHALFLGFVFAMIFGHAPIIFPAITGIPIAFQTRFYAHLVLLHLSLLARVTADLAGWGSVRQWAGLLNVAAVVLFFANTAWSARRLGRMRQHSPSEHPSASIQP